MAYRDAYKRLAEAGDPAAPSEEDFKGMQLQFAADYLQSANYHERLKLHRQPNAVRHEILRELNDYLLAIQNRPEMRDHDPARNSSGYVPAKVGDLWKADKRLGSLFRAVSAYCDLRQKDFRPIAFHIAEYRSLSRLFDRIHKQVYSIPKPSVMQKRKKYDTEIRETFGKEYLKIFLRDDEDYEKVISLLSGLSSVSKVNMTPPPKKPDLTVYVKRAYDVNDMKTEVELALDNYFEGSPNDPVFKNNILSSISDKAYGQIVTHIVRLGKNLEPFKELNVRFGEEQYRDYFIPHLNSLSDQHGSKAEVFNRKGKTDILVFDNDGNNVFIAECKLWKGASQLSAAIDQLLHNYVHWRDEKTALIVFNRDVQKFSDVIAVARKTVGEHGLCIKEMPGLTDTSFSFLFSHPDDAEKVIRLELILFNCN